MASRYERENVIGDPNQTFGIEIEFDGADPNAVARAMHQAGLITSPVQRGYHAARQPGEWSVERDSTVTGHSGTPATLEVRTASGPSGILLDIYGFGKEKVEALVSALGVQAP